MEQNSTHFLCVNFVTKIIEIERKESSNLFCESWLRKNLRGIPIDSLKTEENRWNNVVKERAP